MIMCGHYHTEDGTCEHDGGDPCMGVECPFGLYETEQPDQGDMFESSKCQLIFGNDYAAYQCTMPKWA